MNGAEALVRTLAAGGVDVCFANPGTSEMHFVAALDRAPGIRCVLNLFEGGATAAADAYARMTGKPAATLLHLGTGLSNALANMHNARKAGTPMVNLVGEHAAAHQRLDCALQSDTLTLARPMSHWVRAVSTAAEIGPAAADALAAARARGGQIATLVLNADASWSDGAAPASIHPEVPLNRVPAERVRQAAAALRAGGALLLVGGQTLRAGPAEIAVAIARTCGVPLRAQSRDPRVERGAGRVAIERLPNATGPGVAALSGFRCVVSIGARPPVANFGHPGQPGQWLPDGCSFLELAGDGDDLVATLEALADEVGARPDPGLRAPLRRPALPTGPVMPEALGLALAALIPENAILIDETLTSGRTFFAATATAAPHDYLALTGGAIGWGIPAAAGAAIACPDRKVVALQADGSGLYTVQALWTHARENLDILTVVFANREYAILRNELKNVGITAPGRNAINMLTLDNPPIDWVHLARGFGVPAQRVETMEDFNKAFAAGVKARGPALIEVLLKPVVS